MPQIIFTTHARERLGLRHIALSDAQKVIESPERKISGKKPNTYKFIRHLDGRELQLVATYKPAENSWLVISAWVRGEEDPTSIVWQLITLPFRLCWRLVRWFWSSRR